MSEQMTRIERDSMGEMEIPGYALYGATTARAILNFPLSGIPFSRSFLRALGLIKAACATVNGDLGLLPRDKVALIVATANEVATGDWDAVVITHSSFESLRMSPQSIPTAPTSKS